MVNIDVCVIVIDYYNFATTVHMSCILDLLLVLAKKLLYIGLIVLLYWLLL